MKLLELHFSQLSKIWSKSKNNNYSDNSRLEYHKKLKTLYQLLAKEDFSKISDTDEIKEKKIVLGLFSESITFLDNSTVSSLPFELVKCLELALSEWSSGDKYIIVTSLAKGLNEFSFDPTLAINDSQYEVIKSNYNIEFDKRLIQINIPEYLVGDYLANVIMYHELGHFIEEKFSLPDVILREFLDDYNNGKIKPDFHEFFPLVRKKFTKDIYSDECIDMLKTHIGEYFCDLFASQYIDDSVNHYLSYISDYNSITKTHPQTKSRVKLVKTFLNNGNSYTLDKIKYAVKQMTGEDLKIRFKEFHSKDFLKLLPIEISEVKELHYLFVYGWHLWLGDWSRFEKENKMEFKLSSSKVYEIINDLIEKSIGNYIVNNTWKNVSVKKGNRKKVR
jgi:hypothetical protein